MVITNFNVFIAIALNEQQSVSCTGLKFLRFAGLSEALLKERQERIGTKIKLHKEVM
jgi:hypothetical protein